MGAKENSLTQEGSAAPSFELPDQNGKLHSLAEYRGQKVLLYFYPKDMTPGCTIEALGFQDLEEEYKKNGIIVLGISADSIASHKNFCEKKSLNFTLLSDEKNEVIQKYNVRKEKMLYGKKYMGISRESFLINEKGIIIKHYQKVNPIFHPAEILDEVKKMT